MLEDEPLNKAPAQKTLGLFFCTRRSLDALQHKQMLRQRHRATSSHVVVGNLAAQESEERLRFGILLLFRPAGGAEHLKLVELLVLGPLAAASHVFSTGRCEEGRQLRIALRGRTLGTK